MTRQEHIEWCKKRALEYIHDGDIQGGLTSMLSDIRKHPKTDCEALSSLCMMMIMRGNLAQHEAEKFINSFN